ncbi:hypothetical protein H0H81_006669 [Sphagnurus paluster]|uniref:Uncharacterized protein n=1 Tax=Sphagnurus paluster TaxID=117069 RepID=A0A9P7FP25_9AGAR|nr:hypothetical protein H0H81_006669 [Sphagnurus paluster]
MAPPTKQSQFHQWTVGEVFYSIVIISEILGESNQLQIVDTSNKGIYTLSYAIYGKGTPFNFTDDPTGAHDYHRVASLRQVRAYALGHMHILTL